MCYETFVPLYMQFSTARASRGGRIGERGIRMRCVYARRIPKLFLGSWPCHRVLGTKRNGPLREGGKRGGREKRREEGGWSGAG